MGACWVNLRFEIPEPHFHFRLSSQFRGVPNFKLPGALRGRHTENNSRSKVNQKVPAGRNRLLLQKVSTNFTRRVSDRGLNRHVARENSSVCYQTLTARTHAIGLHHHTRSVGDKRKTGLCNSERRKAANSASVSVPPSTHQLQKTWSAIRKAASWMCLMTTRVAKASPR